MIYLQTAIYAFLLFTCFHLEHQLSFTNGAAATWFSFIFIPAMYDRFRH
jgi:hypothetical protein